MNNKSSMEILYENYLNSDDIVIEIDGVKYYKIIEKVKFPIRRGLVTICVPISALAGNTNHMVVDENGKEFRIGDPAFYTFGGEIPRWDKETITIEIKDISEENDIGLYVASIKR